MQERNAAKVLPEPVGARIRVESPRAIAGQPSSWGLVGAGKTASNHARTGAWNKARPSLGAIFSLSLSLTRAAMAYWMQRNCRGLDSFTGCETASCFACRNLLNHGSQSAMN